MVGLCLGVRNFPEAELNLHPSEPSTIKKVGSFSVDMVWTSGPGEDTAEEGVLVMLGLAGSVIMSLWVTNVAGDEKSSSVRDSKDLTGLLGRIN